MTVHRVTHSFPALLSTVTFALLLSCGASGTDPQKTGTARVLVTISGGAEVSRVVVTVSKGDGPEFSPFTQELAKSGAQWTGRITGIPVGPGRQFDVVAHDAAGSRLYAGSGKTDITPGASAIVAITLQGNAPPPLVNAFPIIESLSWSRSHVPPSATVQLNVTARDPDPGDTLAYRWRATCGLFDDDRKTNPAWTAPVSYGSCQLSITVGDDRGASVTASFVIGVVQAGDAAVDVTLNSWPIVTAMTGSVTLGPTMEGTLLVSAGDPDGDALSYDWTAACPGLVFDVDPPHSPASPHISFPGPSESCAVTVTVADEPSRGGHTSATLILPPNKPLGLCNGVTCQSGQECDAANGTCKPIEDRCAAVTCPASDLCHAPGTCDLATGVCSAETAKVCPEGQSCDVADGTCKASGGLCAGVTCSASDLCHVAGSCNPATGVCSPETAKSCSGTQTCDPADGVCKGESTGGGSVTLEASKYLAISRFDGLAVDVAGASYVAGPVFQPTRTFDGISVTAAGGADLFLGRFDPVTRNAVWARAYGDAADQLPAGVAVTADGTLAAIGSFDGTLTLPVASGAAPSIQNTQTHPIDFLVAVDAATGRGRWAKKFNNGLTGVLLAIAANPSQNLIAVCGYVEVAATELVPGAVHGGRRDAVVGVFDSAGALRWSRQLGAGNDEECNALAIDDEGNVLAAGRYTGALDPGLGSLPNPGGISFRKYIWLAKYAGAAGTPLAQGAFGNFPTGAGNHSPAGLATDAAGRILMSGRFTATLPFGTTSLVSAGSDDAFVAKLELAGSGFSPLWAVRVGGISADEARGVAVDSTGAVIAVGLVQGTTTGAATLTAGGSDALVLRLDGASGATQFAAVYGDGATQNADRVVVNRLGAGAVKDRISLGGSFAGSIDFGAAGSVGPALSNESFLIFAKGGP